MILLDMTRNEVENLLLSGTIPSFKVDHKYQVRHEYLRGWLNEQQLVLEEVGKNGIAGPKRK